MERRVDRIEGRCGAAGQLHSTGPLVERAHLEGELLAQLADVEDMPVQVDERAPNREVQLGRVRAREQVPVGIERARRRLTRAR